MKQAVFRLPLTALFFWAGVSCQTREAAQPEDAPQSPSKLTSSLVPSLAERRVPNRPLHQLLPGVSISADRVTDDAGKKRFSGRVFVDGSAQKLGPLTPGRRALGWPRYATAGEALWYPSSQTLKLYGNPAIQYGHDGLQIEDENAVIALTPSTFCFSAGATLITTNRTLDQRGKNNVAARLFGNL